MDEGEGEQKRRLWADELQHILHEKDKAYQQLMEKAVRFAEAYSNAHLSNWIDLVSEDRAEEMAAKDPVFVEAKAFLKERDLEADPFGDVMKQFYKEREGA